MNVPVEYPARFEHEPLFEVIGKGISRCWALIINGVGLITFSVFFLWLLPRDNIPFAYNPHNLCGTPMGMFELGVRPLIIYGVLRWLLFPRLRRTAVPYLITNFILEMFLVGFVLYAWFTGGNIPEYSSYQYAFGDALAKVISLGEVTTVAGQLLIFWSLFCLGNIKLSNPRLIIWPLVVVYVIQLYSFILVSNSA
jgi:hypothetical protein